MLLFTKSNITFPCINLTAFSILIILPVFCPKSRRLFAKPKNLYICRAFGDIAQLARARDWQSRGQGFDSPYLHQKTNFQPAINGRLSVFSGNRNFCPGFQRTKRQ